MQSYSEHHYVGGEEGVPTSAPAWVHKPRSGYYKKDPLKPLTWSKVEWLNRNWFVDVVDQSQFPHVGPEDEYRLVHKDLLSLKPGNEIWDQTIDAYLNLLKLREDRLRQSRCQRGKFYFMPCCFFQLVEQWWPSYRKLKPTKKSKYDVSDVAPYFFNQGPQPDLAECDFGFFPVNHHNSHYFLFVVDIKQWRVLLLDSFFEDANNDKIGTRYQSELEYMCDFVANALRVYSPEKKFPKKKMTWAFKEVRPKQQNAVDCGVYVMKYVDFIVQGMSLGDVDWSAEDASLFRYRIAHELRKHRARDMSATRVGSTLTNV